MPDEILNPDLYQDRTVQDWHRVRFPRQAWAIDLDLMGACHICREPLYLIEATTNPNKPTTILRALAKRADIPGLVIFHDTEQVRSARLVYPKTNVYGDEITVHGLLVAIRTYHFAQEHPGVRHQFNDQPVITRQQPGGRTLKLRQVDLSWRA